jgi:hypothetical protein
MPRVLLCPKAFAAHLVLVALLFFLQQGALQHAYAHFGLVSDPYATGDSHTPPAQGCDLGAVHAALDGSPTSAATLLSPPLEPAVAAEPAVTGFDPQPVLTFQSRAPPARA